MVAPPKVPANMLIRVINICVVERNLFGSLIRSSAVSACLLPSLTH